MANAKIDIVGKDDLTTVVKLYNQIFQPAKDEAFFTRRLLGRYNPLMMVAVLDRDPVGFATGFELKPNAFFSWLHGVLPAVRRQGIGSQLLDAVQAWALEHGYEHIRLECHNTHRPMLHMCIARGYDIVGLRWDSDRHENLVIFERELE